MPDAAWQGRGPLKVYFKFEPNRPPAETVGVWRREVWNEAYAPLLWVISPHQVDLYNGFGEPLPTGDADANRLGTFRTVAAELAELDSYAGRLAMETGQFWSRAEGLSRETRVDRRLLGDLAALERDLVGAGLARSAAQVLIGRVIFTQYLIDRQILDPATLRRHGGHSELAGALRDPTSARQLFGWLANAFNGDVFLGDEPEDAFGAAQLSRAADFLESVDPRTGQLALFPYRFDIIPIELISTIYEQFAHSSPDEAGTGRNVALGVHYTPLPVVALVLDEVMNGLTGTERVLDLTCGSGVFLVEALRRLVTLKAGPNPSRRLIRATLYSQIVGVDISRSAVRVAAFSLYLTALELDPDPQPPEALTFRPLIGHALHVGDAHALQASQLERTGRKERPFDVIVGNPPWTFEGKEGTARRRVVAGAGGAYPRQPRGQGLDFVVRAAALGHDRTRYGIVLPAPPFFARSGAGSKAAQSLVELLSPVTLVNLAALSNALFPAAKMPAVVFLARCHPQVGDAVTLVNVAWSQAFERASAFTVDPAEISTFSLASWKADSSVMKATAFGVPRDRRLLSRLRSDHDRFGEWLASVGSELRDGLIFGAASNQTREASSLKGLEVLGTNDLQHLRVPDGLPAFQADLAQWPRSRDVYRAPLLLVKEFFRGDARPIAAVSDRDIVYTDAYFGASLPRSSLAAARVISAILTSSFAGWYFLLTGSEFGVWKRRLLAVDVRSMPLPNTKEIADHPSAQALLSIVERASHQGIDPHDWNRLDEAVFDLYRLDPTERLVVRDGFSRANRQWKKGRSESMEPAGLKEDLEPYARIFASVVAAWLGATSSRNIRAEVFDLPSRDPLRVVRFLIEQGKGDPSLTTLRPNSDLRALLSEIGARLRVRLSAVLVGERAVRVQGDDEVVIIKPSARRHWTPAAAITDSEAVVAESVASAPR